jgi:choline dehydrogenase-like flavoprotein
MAITAVQHVSDAGLLQGSMQRLVHDRLTQIITGKMGKRADPMAVVDSNARVFGVEGLRVLDASILPFCVPGHPTGTICKFRWSAR